MGDMDHAVFNQNPPTTYVAGAQQAMSLTHYQKGMEPYLGYGTSYGVAFPMGQSSNFWRFFQRASEKGKLCGQCSDGAKCDPSRREPLGDMSWEEFRQEKNAILDATATATCNPNFWKWQYNEFDTNGLSAPDLAGVFYLIDDALPKNAPQFSDKTLCTFLTNKTQTAKTWPFYLYQFTHEGASSLYLHRLLECGSKMVELV